jgi:predicted outer membrane protein
VRNCFLVVFVATKEPSVDEYVKKLLEEHKKAIAEGMKIAESAKKAFEELGKFSQELKKLTEELAKTPPKTTK